MGVLETVENQVGCSIQDELAVDLRCSSQGKGRPVVYLVRNDLFCRRNQDGLTVVIAYAGAMTVAVKCDTKVLGLLCG